MENHKGFISSNGIPGQGMRMHIYLPVEGSGVEKEKVSMTSSIIE